MYKVKQQRYKWSLPWLRYLDWDMWTLCVLLANKIKKKLIVSLVIWLILHHTHSMKWNKNQWRNKVANIKTLQSRRSSQPFYCPPNVAYIFQVSFCVTTHHLFIALKGYYRGQEWPSIESPNQKSMLKVKSPNLKSIYEIKSQNWESILKIWKLNITTENRFPLPDPPVHLPFNYIGFLY